MGTPVTSGTYIRKLSYSVRRELADYLDPQDRWKDVIILIRKPSGDDRYSQHHVRWVAIKPELKINEYINKA